MLGWRTTTAQIAFFAFSLFVLAHNYATEWKERHFQFIASCRKSCKRQESGADDNLSFAFLPLKYVKYRIRMFPVDQHSMELAQMRKGRETKGKYVQFKNIYISFIFLYYLLPCSLCSKLETINLTFVKPLNIF